MDTVRHAMENISSEQMREFAREMQQPVAPVLRKLNGDGRYSMTPKQYKPTKAEKKAAKRLRRAERVSQSKEIV